MLCCIIISNMKVNMKVNMKAPIFSLPTHPPDRSSSATAIPLGQQQVGHHLATWANDFEKAVEERRKNAYDAAAMR